MEAPRHPPTLFLARIAPAILLSLTATTVFLLQGWAGGSVLLLILLSHPLAHHLVARRRGLVTSWPYCVPAFTLAGTSGAFVKVRWPMARRNDLLAVFTAGPLVGIGASLLALVAGLPLSEVQLPEGEQFFFGEPLLVQMLTKLFFPPIAEGSAVALHPIAFAGWVGLMLNFWHLLPIGRFDGGRLIYALWGWRVMIGVGLATMAALVVAALFWSGWEWVAITGALSFFRLRRQYPTELYDDEPDRRLLLAAALFPLLIILLFNPEPVRFGGL